MSKKSRLVLDVKQYKAMTHEVFTRDKWRCRVPGCGKRSYLHAHHLLFRSHGGDDAPRNVLTVCNICHDAIHGQAKKRGQALVIKPLVEGEPFDASGPLQFTFVNGWRPRQQP